jgi:hypothetical protein
MPHVKQPATVKRVYLVGIAGTAMASLAGMLQQRGYVVSGSDEHVYPPMSTYLERLRIPVLEGYTKEHLETFRPDLVVIGNVAASTNAEAAATLEMDLPYTSSLPERTARPRRRRSWRGCSRRPAGIRAWSSAASRSTSITTSSSGTAPSS